MLFQTSEIKPSGQSPYEIDAQKQIISAFEVFDEDKKGRTKLKNLGTIVRALGRCPTERELQEFAKKVDDQYTPGYMRLEKLLPLLTDVLMEDRWQPAQKENLLKAFEVLDKEKNGYFHPDYIKKLLGGYEESFDEVEVEKFLTAAMHPVTKKINYKRFCEQLVVPEIIDITANKHKIRDELNRSKMI